MENFEEADLNLSCASIIYQNTDKIQILLTNINGRNYTVKKQKLKDGIEATQMIKESSAMQLLHHPYIIKIHNIIFGVRLDYILFVMDYYPEGDLSKEIKNRALRKAFWNEGELLQM